MKMIKYAIGVLAMAVSASTLAVGYSSVENPVTGDIPNSSGTNTLGVPLEDHWVQSYTPTNDCGSNCLAASLQRSEIIIHLQLANRSGCIDDVSQCTPAPAVDDNYNGKDAANGGGASYTGGTAGGVEPDVEELQIFMPARTGDAADPQYVDVGSGGVDTFSLIDWNFTTLPNGKIYTGHAIGSVFLGTNIVGTFNFDKMTLTTYYAANPNSADDVNCLINSAHTDADNCQAQLAGALSRSASFEYITAGMAQLDLGKSVPVPAFAAAALGLGLIGITILTGRRRQIK